MASTTLPSNSIFVPPPYNNSMAYDDMDDNPFVILRSRFKPNEGVSILLNDFHEDRRLETTLLWRRNM